MSLEELKRDNESPRKAQERAQDSPKTATGEPKRDPRKPKCDLSEKGACPYLFPHPKMDEQIDKQI